MTLSITCDADGWKDDAIRGPVRAGGAKIVEFARQLLAGVALAILMVDFAAAAPRPGKPDIGAVTRAVQRYFAAVPNYQPGDLITRDQIKEVLSKLNDAGVTVPGAAQITEMGLANDSFIVRALSTPDGQQFMRKLAKNPGTFPHLDRLSRIPNGEQIIRGLIRDPGGDTLIEYMATTKGGHNLGAMMAQVPGGDLNKPTGRIYTAADLEATLTAALLKPLP